MLRFNEILDRTGKVVGSIAAISIGLAVISFSAVVVRDYVKALLPKKEAAEEAAGAVIICARKEEAPKKTSKKSSKKVVPEMAGVDAKDPESDKAPSTESIE